MIGALILVAMGAAIGYAAWGWMRLPLSQPVAIAAGAIGALVGGLGLKMLLSVFGALLGAVLGAGLVVALVAAFQRDA